MKHSIYSLGWHDKVAIFHALKIRLILRVILSITCGVSFGRGERRAGCFFLPMVFSLSKKGEQSL